MDTQSGQHTRIEHHADPMFSHRTWRVQLPASKPNLIGRSSEHDTLLAHLGTPGRRLLTLLGPGGMGKTSLALNVASSLANAPAPVYRDGVAFIGLAAVSQVDDMPLAIADVLGIELYGARPVIDQLVEALYGRSVLLILDNIEHLLAQQEGAKVNAYLLQLLNGAPDLQLLVTSRERLRLQSEWVVQLGGLAVPASDQGAAVDQSDAVQLFVERAQRSVATFALNDACRAPVAQICRLLGGMPLAIELAASWVRALTPAEIIAEIGRALDLLAMTAHDLPARHRSIRATLDHSWNLLDTSERSTLARLSVFAEGCERDAATAVTGTTLPALIALIDKSLLDTTQVDGVTWYRLHPLVRQYATERLADDADDQRMTQARHIRHFAGVIERTIDLRTGATLHGGRALLHRNIGNIRMSWNYALTQQDVASLTPLIRVFQVLYDDYGWLREAAALFDDAAESLRAIPAMAPLRGHIIGVQSYFLTRIARYQEARAAAQQALSILESAGDAGGVAAISFYYGISLVHVGEFQQADVHFRRAAAYAQENGDLFMAFWSNLWVALIDTFAGDYAIAEERIRTSFPAVRASGYVRAIGSGWSSLGEIVRCGGRHEEAASFLREGLKLANEHKDTLILCACLTQLGAVACAQGNTEEGRSLLQEGTTIGRELGDSWMVGRALSLQVRCEVARGDFEAARLAATELGRIALSGEAMLVGDALLCFAIVLARAGHPAEAWALLQRLATVAAKAELRPPAAALRNELAADSSFAHNTAPDRRTTQQWLAELVARPLVLRTAATSPSAISATPSGSILVASTGETLSIREVEVLRMIAAGANNAEIAQGLVISLHTVKSHVAHILAKLNVASRTAAAVRSRELGLV